MKRTKKLAALIMCALLACTAMTACQNSGDNGADSQGSSKISGTVSTDGSTSMKKLSAHSANRLKRRTQA